MRSSQPPGAPNVDSPLTPDSPLTRSVTSQETHRALKALKKLLEKDSGLNANKQDEFLMCFLRHGSTNPKRAFRMIKHYYTARHKERDVFRNLLPSWLSHVFSKNLMVVLPDKDVSGRLVMVVRAGAWDPSQLPFMDALRGLLLCLEYVMRDSVAQVQGLSFICDMDGWGYSHMSSVPTNRIKALSGVLAGYPIKARRMDIVNQSYAFNIFFKMLTPFLDQKAMSKVHFHGTALHKIHKRFPKNILPRELGGTKGPLNSAEFYERLMAKEAAFAEELQYGISPTV